MLNYEIASIPEFLPDSHHARRENEFCGLPHGSMALAAGNPATQKDIDIRNTNRSQDTHLTSVAGSSVVTFENCGGQGNGCRACWHFLEQSSRSKYIRLKPCVWRAVMLCVIDCVYALVRTSPPKFQSVSRRQREPETTKGQVCENKRYRFRHRELNPGLAGLMLS